MSTISLTHTHIPQSRSKHSSAGFHQNNKSNNCLQWQLESSIWGLKIENFHAAKSARVLCCADSLKTHTYSRTTSRGRDRCLAAANPKDADFATTIVVNGSWSENEMFPGRSLKMDMVARLQPIQVKTSSSAKAIVVNVLARRLVPWDGWKGDK